MNRLEDYAIPLPTIRRFPAYLRLLKDHANQGKMWISATTLADQLKLKPIQVRKDMACTGVEGKPKVGFQVCELIVAIEQYLGWDNTTDAILIGAGNLGAALIGYKGFENILPCTLINFIFALLSLSIFLTSNNILYYLSPLNFVYMILYLYLPYTLISLIPYSPHTLFP